jgi:hypothetical protein
MVRNHPAQTSSSGSGLEHTAALKEQSANPLADKISCNLLSPFHWAEYRALYFRGHVSYIGQYLSCISKRPNLIIRGQKKLICHKFVVQEI